MSDLDGERRVDEPRRLLECGRAGEHAGLARHDARGAVAGEDRPGEVAVAGEVLARARAGPPSRAACAVAALAHAALTSPVTPASRSCAGRRSVMCRRQRSSSTLGEVVAQVHAARLLAQQRALGDLRAQREQVEQLVLGHAHAAEAQLGGERAQLGERRAAGRPRGAARRPCRCITSVRRLRARGRVAAVAARPPPPGGRSSGGARPRPRRPM